MLQGYEWTQKEINRCWHLGGDSLTVQPRQPIDAYSVEGGSD